MAEPLSTGAAPTTSSPEIPADPETLFSSLVEHHQDARQLRSCLYDNSDLQHLKQACAKAGPIARPVELEVQLPPRQGGDEAEADRFPNFLLWNLQQRSDETLEPTDEWLALRRRKLTASRFGRILEAVVGAEKARKLQLESVERVRDREQVMKKALEQGGDDSVGAVLSGVDPPEQEVLVAAGTTKSCSSLQTPVGHAGDAEMQTYPSSEKNDAEGTFVSAAEMVVDSVLSAPKSPLHPLVQAAKLIPPPRKNLPNGAVARRDMVNSCLAPPEQSQGNSSAFGIVNEGAAREAYVEKRRNDAKKFGGGPKILEVVEIGSCLQDFLVASPDGFVIEERMESGSVKGAAASTRSSGQCVSTPTFGLLEIKTCRDESKPLSPFASDPPVAVWCQIQGSMALARHVLSQDGLPNQLLPDFCDLVCWSHSEIVVRRVPFDGVFWEEVLRPLLTWFFRWEVLPEFFERNSAGSKVEERVELYVGGAGGQGIVVEDPVGGGGSKRSSASVGSNAVGGGGTRKTAGKKKKGKKGRR